MRFVIVVLVSFTAGTLAGRSIGDAVAESRIQRAEDKRMVEIVCRTLVEANLVKTCRMR